MRTYLRGLIAALGAALLLGARGSWAACGCGQATCAEVLIDEDNRVDFNCAPELVGQSLPDSDGDGIPDACDACACVSNPIDEDTGRARPCPAPEPPPSDNALRCEGGKLVGIRPTATVWLLRPQTYAFTRFEPDTSQLAAGPELLVLHGAATDRCTNVDVGGKSSIRLIPAPWHWRAAAFASLTVSVPDVGASATLGLSSGLDYRFPASLWTLGPSLHLMTLFGSIDETPLLLGLGPRIGIADFIALTPFVQLDALHDFQASYGAWLTLDVGALEDLGVTLGL